jgi:alpha/beta hydrolase family protein
MAAFVLIHSPFVGPLTWQPTARVLADRGHIVVMPALNVGDPRPPYWSHYASSVVATARTVPARHPLVLVAHSAAGLLIPAVGAATPERAIRRDVFVDATLPRGYASLADLIPAGLGITMEQLRAQAQDEFLPPWGTGWPDELWRQLIPDVSLRERFVQELRPAPLALYEEHPPVVDGWPDALCGYLRFSALYADAEEQARRAGWQTREVSGGHLHMLVEPAAVADALIELTS